MDDVRTVYHSALIQIGGLGFMTIGVFFAIILRRKIGLWMRGTLQESVNILQIGGIVRLAKKIMLGTLLFEGVGAALLAFRFQEQMGWGKAVYYGSSTPFPHSAMPDSI